MEESLVSVVVPAYNVSQYLSQCVYSVLNQKNGRIELIIVDDGSTDGTGKVADDIASTDDRVIVIHKENQGVSSARNIGIEIAKGEYVVFVDADDFIAEDYIEYMLNMAKTTGADLCISTDCFLYNGQHQNEIDKIRILSAEDGTALLLSPRVYVGCWNKIFKKSVLIENHIRFDEQLFFGEGLNFIVNFVQKANKLAVGNRRVYYYRRSNESSATTIFSIQKIRNGLLSISKIQQNLYINTKKVKDMLLLHSCLYRVMSIVKIKSSGTMEIYNDEYSNYRTFLRKNLFKMLRLKCCSLYSKSLILACVICPSFVAFLSRAKRKFYAIKSVK